MITTATLITLPEDGFQTNVQIRASLVFIQYFFNSINFLKYHFIIFSIALSFSIQTLYKLLSHFCPYGFSPTYPFTVIFFRFSSYFQRIA